MNVETNSTAEAGPATASIEEAARLTFEPWLHEEGEPEPPSDEEWKDLGEDHLPVVRLAWVTMFSTKEQIVHAFVRDQAMMIRFTDSCGDSIEFFKAFVSLLEAVEMRLLVAASASCDEVAA